MNLTYNNTVNHLHTQVWEIEEQQRTGCFDKKCDAEQDSYFKRDSCLYNEFHGSLKVNDTSYLLLKPLKIATVFQDGAFLSYLPDEQSCFGISETRDGSIDELKFNLHIKFQRLVRKRPFEMQKDEMDEWKWLTTIIDFLHYKLYTPITQRLVGCVSYGRRSYPNRIKWLDGSYFSVDLPAASRELLSCKPGQWIEASVKVNPRTNKVISIDSIFKISYKIPTNSEIDEYWEKLKRD